MRTRMLLVVPLLVMIAVSFCVTRPRVDEVHILDQIRQDGIHCARTGVSPDHCDYHGRHREEWLRAYITGLEIKMAEEAAARKR